eukprot:120229_1
MTDSQTVQPPSMSELDKMLDEIEQTEKEADAKRISPNEQCKSIQSCKSIHRIINYLKMYETIDIKNVCKTFNAESIPFINDDFNHVLLNHLGDQHTLQFTKKQYEDIYDYMTQNYLSTCSLVHCEKSIRNNRARESNSQMSVDSKTQYIIDIMDTLHCFFMHSFDVGFRIRSKDLIDIDETKQNDYDLYTDSQMEKLSKILDRNRKQLQNVRGLQRLSTSKFVTDMKNDDNDDSKLENDKIEMDSYSFGHEYNYWDKNSKHLITAQRNFIEAKYENLCDELLNNKILSINKQSFDTETEKAQNKLKTDYAKQLIADNYMIHRYNIREGTQISLQHILAIIFYTSYDTLSYNFSKTFRSTNKTETFNDCKARNSEYALWSRLLCEAVNVFGKTVGYKWGSKIKIFYHGINCLLYFSSFVSTFNSPISTSPQITVAAIFAKPNGVIIELGKDAPSLRYFNCSWLSSYSSEDERLFIMPRDPLSQQLRFVSIRSIATNSNYYRYMHALTSFNYVIDNQDDDINDRDHKVRKRDVQIINKLLKTFLNGEKNNFPLYINDLFEIFVKNKTEIQIKIKSME